MAPGMRWGLTLRLAGPPLAQPIDLIARLPDLGCTDAWSHELTGPDAFMPLTLAAPTLTARNAGDRKDALAAMPGELSDELLIRGHAEHCQEPGTDYDPAGPDTPLIAVVPPPGADLGKVITRLAPA